MTDTFDMNNIIKTFSTASRVVFNEMIKCKVNPECKYEKRDSYKSREYSFITEVTGKLEGTVTMSMDKKTAFNITSAMTGSQPVEKFEDIDLSALSELINIAVGRSFSLLTDEGDLILNQPVFKEGSNVLLSIAGVQETYVTTLETEIGEVDFNVSLFCT